MNCLRGEFRHERRLTLFPDRHFPTQLVEEVFEEGHVVLRLLRFRYLDWRCRGNAFPRQKELTGKASRQAPRGGYGKQTGLAARAPPSNLN